MSASSIVGCVGGGGGMAGYLIFYRVICTILPFCSCVE